MNDVKDQLRDAFQVAAETVRQESIRPYVLAAAPDHTHSTRRSGMFVPLAAATAVVVTIGAAVAVPRLLPSTSVTAAPTGSSAANPPFLVQLPYTGTATAKLVVQAAGTRQVTAVVSPPTGTQWAGVAATGRGTAFVAAATNHRDCVTTFYGLTLSGAGHSAELWRLALPVVSGQLITTTALAASADGHTVAYATAPCGTDNVAPRTIGTLTMGVARRVLTLPASAKYTVTSLSLSADGTLLSYVIFAGQALDRSNAVVMPIDSLSTGRAIRSVGGAKAAALSPDGKTLYAVIGGPSPGSPGGAPYTFVLAACHTYNGRVRALHTWRDIRAMLAPAVTTGGSKLLVWGISQPDTVEVDPATGKTSSYWMYTPDGEFPESVAW